ncbi:MAG: thioesterase family protein [Actinomycetota bacterium]
MTAPHRTTIRVRFYELDPYNHVNHSVYVSYFESARVELLAEVGFSLASMREQGQSIVVSEIRTRFLGSAEELDELTIETEIVELKRVTTTWRQRILRNDEVLVTQEIRAAMLDARGRPTRFSSEMLDALAPFVVDA